MRKIFYPALLITYFTCIPFLLLGSEKKGTDTSQNLPSSTQISETFGYIVGKNMKNPSLGVHFDLESVIIGIRNAYTDKPPPMDENDYMKAISELHEKALADIARQNLTEANLFLEQNAQDNTVIIVEPGKLHYVVLTEGSGEAVKEHATTQIHYEGKYINGEVFGSSLDSQPVVLSLDQAISGLSKGLLGAKHHEKRRIFIHPDLAYGTSGHLSPNSLLIFDIEVVEPAVEEGFTVSNETELDAQMGLKNVETNTDVASELPLEDNLFDLEEPIAELIDEDGAIFH